jgi:UDP-N-acetylmuramoylalanine--D-glutamate ligase
VQSKQRLLRLQPEGGVAVLNLADPEVAAWRKVCRGRPLAAWPEEWLPALRVPGRHNRVNGSLAAAAARALGCSADAACRGLAGFGGLPHRLEMVGEINQRCFYNDSKATTPEAAIAALEAFDAGVWILVGGHAKGGNYAALARAIGACARGVACFGRAAAMLAAELERHAPQVATITAHSLNEGFDWCWRQSQPGEVILLSPGCASFDQYRDFSHRGEVFRTLVEAIR